uniref:Protein SPT2 n=1 Tax=Anthurium amnicola TaxID=1678845 RepID=A0A1D1Z0P1_9ARAE
MWDRGGHDAHQSYDDLDEYETDDNSQEEEEAESEEEEKDPKPTKEEMEYLKMREKIKEKIRQKYRKENAAAFGPTYSRDKSGKATNAQFGTFFGPSQCVIAPRVIEERRSIRETQHIVAKPPSSFSGGKRASTSAEMKTVVSNKPHKTVNELKTKVQTLKSMRDYSFLLSDDADIPASAKAPVLQNVSNLASDNRSGQARLEARMSTGKPVKRISDGHISKSSFSRDQPGQIKAEHQKTAPPIRPKPSSKDPRKLVETKGGNGHGPSMVSKKFSHAAAQDMVTKKASPAGLSKANIERIPSSMKPRSSAQDRSYEQRRQIQDVGRGKMLPKQTISSSKPQLPEPSKQVKQRSMHEDRPERKPARKPLRNPFDEDDDDIDDPMSFLRNNLLSRYNSSRYQADDDDDSDMEANFDEIMKEERRSLKIARQEDEEQLLLIEEEERRERMRREAKKQKLVRR